MNQKSNVISNMLWRFAERCGAQGVSFIVSIVLARILAPEQYGTVALVTIFTSILSVFVDSGMGNALIQKKDADDLDFSTVFYFNFAICIVLYICMFFAAPWIAAFYQRPELVSLVRVLSLTLIISGVKNVQQAYVSRNMLFKRFFFSTLGGTICAAVVGIVMAYCGFGVWALVAQQLLNALIDTAILWLTVRWRPKWMFSIGRWKQLFSFGWKLLASGLLNIIYLNLRQLIVGKMYSTADLAYYNKGNQFPDFIVSNLNTSIDSVLLPTMSSQQDAPQRLKAITRKSIKTSGYIMWPAMVGLAVCAQPLVKLLFTEKWLMCVPFLRIFCFTYVFYPIHTANLNAIKAAGRSDFFLKLEIIKKVIETLSILVAMRFGPMAIAFASMALGPISAIINAFPNKILLNYSIKEQLLDLCPYIVLSMVMGVCIWPIQYLSIRPVSVLVVQVFSGLGIYLFGSWLLHLEIFKEIIDVVKGFVKK